MKPELKLYTYHCTGCGRCTRACRRGVLQLADNGSCRFVTIADASRCRGCGHCVRSCPHEAIALHKTAEVEKFRWWQRLRMVLQFVLPVTIAWPWASGAAAWKEADYWQLFGLFALLHLLLFHLRLPRFLRKTQTNIE